MDSLKDDITNDAANNIKNQKSTAGLTTMPKKRLSKEKLELGKLFTYQGIKAATKKTIIAGMIALPIFTTGMITENYTHITQNIEYKAKTYRRIPEKHTFPDPSRLEIEVEITEDGFYKTVLRNNDNNTSINIDRRGLAPGTIDVQIYRSIKNLVEKGQKAMIRFTKSGKIYILEKYKSAKDSIEQSRRKIVGSIEDKIEHEMLKNRSPTEKMLYKSKKKTEQIYHKISDGIIYIKDRVISWFDN